MRSPGPTRTPGLPGAVPKHQQDDVARSVAAALPAGRLGGPDEIASAALLPASDAATFVDGRVVRGRRAHRRRTGRGS